MESTEHHDAHVHAEVEDLEQLRLGEREDNDSAKLRQSYTTQNLRHEQVTI